MRYTRTTWIRSAIGLTALSALVLTGCGASSDDAASFSDGDGTEDAAPASGPDESPEAEEVEPEPEYDYRVEPGFFATAISKDLTTTNTIRPTNKTVTTPAGTLTINEIEELDDIAADTAGLEAAYDEITDEELPYGPAEGEVLRVIDLGFVPSQADGVPATDISLKINGTQTHLSELASEYNDRILVSVPRDGSAQLVVSSDGHDQFVDLLTGERAEDPVTATYYRDVTRQEPHHVLRIASSEFPVLVDWGEVEESVNTVTYDVQIDAVELSAWQPDDGWAPEGRAWAVIDWTYSVENVGAHNWSELRVESFHFDLAVDSDEEQSAISIAEADSSTNHYEGRDRRDYVSVPAGTSTITLSVAGETTVVERGDTTLVEGVDATAAFSSAELSLDFPGGATASADDEPAEDGAAEEPADDEASPTPDPSATPGDDE